MNMNHSHILHFAVEYVIEKYVNPSLPKPSK